MRWAFAAVLGLLLVAGAGQGGLVRTTGPTATGEAAAVQEWIAKLQFTTAGIPGEGAVLVSEAAGHSGGGQDWHQVNPYFASQGMLGYVRSNAPDRLARTWAYLQWDLAHRTADGRILNHWYAANGTLEATCPPGVDALDLQNKCDYEDASDSYAANLLTLAAAYHVAGGTGLGTAAMKAKLEAIADLITDTLIGTNPDHLAWARSDYKVKYLMDNAEVHQGLRAIETLESSLYLDATRAAKYGAAAAAVGTAIRQEFFVAPDGPYAIAKDEAGGLTAANPAEWYRGGAPQFWPVLTGAASPSDPETAKALAWVERLWGGPTPRNWTSNTVDAVGQAWAAVGHAAHRAGLDLHARTHTEYLLCRVMEHAYPVEYAFGWPFHVGDAGFLLQDLDAGLRLPAGTFVCPPRAAGAWVPVS